MQDIRKIPPVQAYLLDIEIFTQLKQVAHKHGIDEKRVDEFLDLTDAVTKGELEVANMPQLATQAFGLDQAKSEALCADIAGYRLLPLANYINGVESAITSWGGKVEDYPEKRVAKQQLDIDKRIRELASELQLELPEHLMKRFVFVVRGYATDERTKEATATLMKRPLNIGGLHMSDAQVQNMLALIDKEKNELVDKKPDTKSAGEKVVPASEPKKSQDKSQDSVPANGVEEVSEQPKISKEELRQKLEASQEDYLAMLREFGDVDLVEELPPEAVPAAPKTEPVNTPVSQTKAETTSQQAPHSDDEQLPMVKPTAEVANEVPVVNTPKKRKRKRRKRKKKSEAVAPATKAVEDSQKPKEKTTEVNKALETAKPAKEEQETSPKPVPTTSPLGREAAVNQALAPVVDIFKKNRIAKKVFASVATAHVKGRRDPLKTYELLKTEHGLSGADLDAAFKALEQGRKIAQGEYRPDGKKLSEGQSEDTRALEKEVLDKRHAAMTKKVAGESVDPLLPSGQVSAARSKKEELEVQKSKIDEEKVKNAQEASRPKKAKAKLSMKSAPPTDGGGKMQDVKFVQKLVGPVEELGMMNAPEFRRLSSDPTEATQKILDKLSLLQESSYDQRIAGIKAWRSSPINKLYLKMANDALMKGISVQEVASVRRNAGEESLKPAEIQAIVALNSKISF